MEYIQSVRTAQFDKAAEVFPDPWHFRRYIESAVELVSSGRVDVAAIAKTVVPCEEGPRILMELTRDPSAYIGVVLKW